MPIPLSVTIIARNEESRLGDCLKSVWFADELLVVDSGSSDGTVVVAESRGARVIHQDWLGYGPQKQFAVDQARHDWVLCLDADERLSDDLAEAVRGALVEEPLHQAYEMPRCNRFMDHWLGYGEGYPDRSLRLFNRQYARWSLDPVHEKVETDGPVGRLDADLLHRSENGLADYLAKQNRYTSLQANALFEAGRRVGAAKLLLSPLLRFFKFYLLRAGFRDGIPGLIHILIGCHNSFMKYAKLLELQRRS